jgi:adenosine/AMP kinase
MSYFGTIVSLTRLAGGLRLGVADVGDSRFDVVACAQWRAGRLEPRMELTAIRIEKPDDLNIIIGQAHFIKTVEDLHEALAGSSPQLRFGIAFCEASGACLIRRSGNDQTLVDIATQNAQAISAGHSFVVVLREGFPVNVLNTLKQVSEVCLIFCATANQVEVVVAETELGRGILGVVDGAPPVGVETVDDEADRKLLLRRIGYKL